MIYKIISTEDELLIESKNKQVVVDKFLEYVLDTQQEYIDCGDKTEEEVDELMNCIRFDFGSLENENNIFYFNQTLIDYGFEPLIVIKNKGQNMKIEKKRAISYLFRLEVNDNLSRNYIYELVYDFGYMDDGAYLIEQMAFLSDSKLVDFAIEKIIEHKGTVGKYYNDWSCEEEI